MVLCHQRARASCYPTLQRHLQLIIDDEDDVPSRRSVGQVLRDPRPDAALRFLFDESVRHRVYATNPGISFHLETLFGDAWRRAPATE